MPGFQEFIDILFAGVEPYAAVLQDPHAQNLFADILAVAKITSAVVSVLLFFGIVMVVMMMYRLLGTSPLERLSESVRATAIPKERVTKQWERIKSRIARASPAEWKLALIEADKLCDNTLRRMGYRGETMDHRLQSIKPAQLTTLENLKNAHALYVAAVQDPSFVISQYEVQQALRNFEEFLKEMQLVL